MTTSFRHQNSLAQPNCLARYCQAVAPQYSVHPAKISAQGCQNQRLAVRPARETQSPPTRLVLFDPSPSPPQVAPALWARRKCSSVLRLEGTLRSLEPHAIAIQINQSPRPAATVHSHPPHPKIPPRTRCELCSPVNSACADAPSIPLRKNQSVNDTSSSSASAISKGQQLTSTRANP